MSNGCDNSFYCFLFENWLFVFDFWQKFEKFWPDFESGTDNANYLAELIGSNRILSF